MNYAFRSLDAFVLSNSFCLWWSEELDGYSETLNSGNSQ